MVFSGESKEWKALLPLIPDILELVLNTWREFKKPPKNTREEPITRKFLLSLRREKRIRDLPFRIKVEDSLSDPVDGSETGRVDLSFEPCFSPDEDIYFGFECKRLNVDFPSGFSSRAREYVGDGGMMCFVTEQYGQGLSAGGMIGYVMDGEVHNAIRTVGGAIDRKRGNLCLLPNSKLAACSLLFGEKTAKETQHDLSGRRLTLFHLFLPFPSIF